MLNINRIAVGETLSHLTTTIFEETLIGNNEKTLYLKPRGVNVMGGIRFQNEFSM